MSTTFAAMERCRASLGDLIEAAAAEIEAERQEQARQAAAAIEYANSAANISAAYHQGREDERRRILALIEHQQHALVRSGINSLSLAALRRSIAEAE